MEPTYEGLKLDSLCGSWYAVPSLEPTYEGLKHVVIMYLATCVPAVWSLPMRD